MKKKVLFCLLAALGTVLLLWKGEKISLTRSEEAGGHQSVAGRSFEQLRGAVVYEHRGGIYRKDVGPEGKAVRLTEKGRYPRWSSDGKYIVFLRDRKLMRMSAEGGDEELLVTVEAPRAVATHSDGRRVIFTDARTVKSFEFESRKVETLIRGYRCMEIDVSADGKRLVATVKKMVGYQIHAFNLETGKARKMVKGCSASLSPDGELFTQNDGSHRRLTLRTWKKGEIKTILSPPEGFLFDNQFWSNDEDWIVSRSEKGPEDIYLHQVTHDRAYRLTFSGDADRPDLYLYKP